jgi:hypothetical protein
METIELRHMQSQEKAKKKLLDRVMPLIQHQEGEQMRKPRHAATIEDTYENMIKD